MLNNSILASQTGIIRGEGLCPKGAPSYCESQVCPPKPSFRNTDSEC